MESLQELSEGFEQGVAQSHGKRNYLYVGTSRKS